MRPERVNSSNDQELVRQVVNGNKEVFKILIKQHQRLVLSIVHKMIPGHDDRKDVSQDVFIKVYTYLEGFKFESSLSTWIGRITYTTCLNFLKKRKETYLKSFQNEPSNEAEELIGNPEPADVEYMKAILYTDLKRKVEAEMDRLPPVMRTIITLYHQEGLSYNEICGIVMLPLGTVKSHLFRARKLFKQYILENYKKEDLL